MGVYILADEFTDWFNPPDYERDQYDSLERNSKVERTSMIKCGRKPAEAPDCTNGCLFNMRHDPCEYHDLSQVKNDVFEQLKAKLENYKKEMVPPRYKHDEDPNANPRNHGGVWSPWIDAEGEPVDHKPLPPEHKLPGQEDAKPEEEKLPTANAAIAPPQEAQHQQPTPSQQAPSQEVMKEKLMIPTTAYASRKHEKERSQVYLVPFFIVFNKHFIIIVIHSDFHSQLSS